MSWVQPAPDGYELQRTVVAERGTRIAADIYNEQERKFASAYRRYLASRVNNPQLPELTYEEWRAEVTGQRRTPVTVHVPATAKRRGPILNREGETEVSKTRDRGLAPFLGEYERGSAGFLQWLRRDAPTVAKALRLTHPELFTQTMGNTKPGNTTAGGFLTSIANTLREIAPAYMQFRSQNQLMNLQLERARQGLPPLDTSQYGIAPMSVQHSLNVPPSVQRQIGIGAGSTLLIAAAVGTGVYLLARRK